MSKIIYRGIEVDISGELPAVGQKAPDFRLTKTDMNDVHLSDFSGKRIVLNIFPSIDTGVCAASVRKFNQLASELENTVVICISKDLPYAFIRFCGAEGIENVVCASQYKDDSFSKRYGVDLLGGRLEGLMSRALIVADEQGEIIFSQLVSDIGHEPDYDGAIAALRQ